MLQTQWIENNVIFKYFLFISKYNIAVDCHLSIHFLLFQKDWDLSMKIWFKQSQCQATSWIETIREAKKKKARTSWAKIKVHQPYCFLHSDFKCSAFFPKVNDLFKSVYSASQRAEFQFWLGLLNSLMNQPLLTSYGINSISCIFKNCCYSKKKR